MGDILKLRFPSLGQAVSAMCLSIENSASRGM